MNIITIFLEKKRNLLVDVCVKLLNIELDDLKEWVNQLFSVYIDNRYYNIFYSIDSNSYTDDNLMIELKEKMYDLLYKFSEKELELDNEVFSYCREVSNSIVEMVYLISLLDSENYLDAKDIDEYVYKVYKQSNINIYFNENDLAIVTDLLSKLQKLDKLVLDSKDVYFKLKFISDTNNTYTLLDLDYSIDALKYYKNKMVMHVLNYDDIIENKTVCMINKISLLILKNIILHKEITKYFVKINSKNFFRGHLKKNIRDMCADKIFMNNIIFSVDFSVNKDNLLFEELGNEIACIQDFSHINDVKSKINAIKFCEKFSYLFVSGYKQKDLHFFNDLNSKSLKIMVLEDE